MKRKLKKSKSEIEGKGNLTLHPSPELRFSWYRYLRIFLFYACQEYLNQVAPPPPTTFINYATCTCLIWYCNFSCTIFFYTYIVFCKGRSCYWSSISSCIYFQCMIELMHKMAKVLDVTIFLWSPRWFVHNLLLHQRKWGFFSF